jgi:hypothetical protein
MKKLIPILILLASLSISSNSYAVDWHKADSAIVGWDAVTTYYDDTPFPADRQGVAYYVYTKDVNGSNVRAEGNTFDVIQFAVTLAEGEKKYVGISAVMIDVDGIASDESTVAWSNEPIYCLNGVVFGVHNLKRPKNPKDLNKQ